MVDELERFKLDSEKVDEIVANLRKAIDDEKLESILSDLRKISEVQ
jgi:hypothetical protein